MGAGCSAESLSQNFNENEMKRMMIEVQANNRWTELLQPDQFEEISRAFCKFDRDNNGFIEAHELHDSLQALGLQPTPSMVQTLLDSVDVDRNGKVEFEEFVLIMCKRILEEDGKAELEEAFLLLGSAGNPDVCNVAELRSLLTTAGNKPMSEAEVNEFLATAGPADEKAEIPFSKVRDMTCWQLPLLPTNMVTSKSSSSTHDHLNASMQIRGESEAAQSIANLHEKSKRGNVMGENTPPEKLPPPDHGTAAAPDPLPPIVPSRAPPTLIPHSTHPTHHP